MSEMQPPSVVPGYTYEHAQRVALELEALLASYGIAIERGTVLEQIVLSVLDIVYRKTEGKKVPVDEDIRRGYRNLIGIAELGGLLLEVRNHADFDQLVPHLQLLNRGTALQNLPAAQRDQATNKIFELFVATLAMQCGCDIRLDHPEASSGDNPDILATIDGQRWGLACKVIHTRHPGSFTQHLAKGIDQIERSEATTGVVMFNLKNILDHDSFWPMVREANLANGEPAEFGCFVDPTTPFRLLWSEVNRFGSTIRDDAPAGYIEGLFSGKKAAPVFYLWAQTASGIVTNGLPTPTTVRVGVGARVLALTEQQARVLECLYWAAFVDSPQRPSSPLAKPQPPTV